VSRKDLGLPPTGAAAIFDGTSGHQRLMSALGYSFIDLGLLQTALTHPSANTRKNNQRLEFLGDAVLQLVISELLYNSSKEAEGKLTFKRQRLVNEQTLAQVARGIQLGEHLVLGRHFAQDGGRELDSVLADAMEAVLAAVYFDGGLQAANQVVQLLFQRLVTEASDSLDAKGALQAHFQGLGEEEPVYVDLASEGPPHRRVFTVAVKQSGRLLATGTDTTKRSAQQRAARAAMDNIRKGGGQP